jgi:DNA-binding MarR family transcriptional regulator
VSSAAGAATPPKVAFASMPGHLIRRAQQIAVAVFMDHASDLAVTPIQFAALAAVEAHAGIDATRLAGLIALDKPTTGGVVERLVAKGFLARTADAADRRVKRLAITPDGQRHLRRVEVAVRAAQADILKPLAPADRDTFVRLLAALVEGNNTASRAPMRALAGADRP